MGYLLEKAMTPAVLDHAWRLVKDDRGLWQRGLPRTEMEGNLLRHVGALAWLWEWVRRGWGWGWLGDADILTCFDAIPVEGVLQFLWLLGQDAEIVALVRQWVDSVPPRFRPGPPGCGLPQGMVLSPFLCNLYLHSLDKRLDEECVPFVRFADDFIVMGRDRDEAEAGLAVAADQLGLLGLELHPEKTQVILSSPRHSFLGCRLPDGRPRFQA